MWHFIIKTAIKVCKMWCLERCKRGFNSFEEVKIKPTYKDQYQILKRIWFLNRKQQEIKASWLFGVVLRLISCYNLDTNPPLSLHTHTNTSNHLCLGSRVCFAPCVILLCVKRASACSYDPSTHLHREHWPSLLKSESISARHEFLIQSPELSEFLSAELKSWSVWSLRAHH